MNILMLVAVAFALAPFAGWAGGRGSTLVAVVPAVLFAAFCFYLPDISAGQIVREVHSWVPSLDVAASLRLDGLSLTFALLITGIGTVVFLYASAYLRRYRQLGRFFIVLTLFMGSMLGAVLADDLILLVVFWELTSLTSFLLIGFTPEKSEARRAAQQGFLVTVAGGLAMLAGIILLGSVAGTNSISEVLQRGEIIAASPASPAIIVLIALGAFAKSAQVPLHSWLANAMVAPTPVSAYLHSATMVKLGVYLLARFDPVFGAQALWIVLLTIFGTATMLVGAVLAMRETDLKLVLAYSTIVTLGVLTVLVGVPGEIAAIATMTLLIAHALYKACLFLVVGIIEQTTGTRDGVTLYGLNRYLPLTNTVALLGGLSMAGLPPFLGFFAKEVVYESGLSVTGGWLITAILLIANAVMIIIAMLIAVRCFSGAAPTFPRKPRDPGFALLGGPALLGTLGLFFGIAPWFAAYGLILPGASAIYGSPIAYTFSIWHGFTLVLVLTIVTLVLGFFAYQRWDVLRTKLSAMTQIDSWGPDRGYDAVIGGVQRIATWQTELIQNGSLRVYLGRVLAIAALALIGTLVVRNGFVLPSFSGALSWDLVLAGFLITAALAVLQARNFVTGIVAAGVVGFSVALVFLFNGAPDLAFTQFSVEALAIVILLAIVGRLPFRDKDYRTPNERRRDAWIALSLGVAVTAVLLSVLSQPFDGRLSDYFRAASVPEAQGRNLVNVIIVDFRALDTLGEITVLGLAALAAAAVIAGLRTRISEKRS
ncbi:hydrogen gas-evolving membrane-bound hydrogenase subunit E [Leptospira interrogans]